MFKLMEVTERSDLSYSDAVKNAVEKVQKEGEKVHFFTVSEFRGAVINEKIEYQVIVKIAHE